MSVTVDPEEAELAIVNFNTGGYLRRVSTGRSAQMLRMHSDSIYRYYRKHRAAGWRRATLLAAWAALRLRAELEALRGRITTR